MAGQKNEYKKVALCRIVFGCAVNECDCCPTCTSSVPYYLVPPMQGECMLVYGGCSVLRMACLANQHCCTRTLTMTKRPPRPEVVPHTDCRPPTKQRYQARFNAHDRFASSCERSLYVLEAAVISIALPMLPPRSLYTR